MVDMMTVGVSVASSLVVSYVGVRYFTGPRLRAERAHAARIAIRDVVSPMRRDLRGYRAHIKSGLDRDGAAHADDGVTATRLLSLTHDLPRLRRWLVRRRLDTVFGSGWMRAAQLRDSTVPDEEHTMATHAMVLALFDERDGVKRRSYIDGLLHRAFIAGPDSLEAKRLERELLLLSETR